MALYKNSEFAALCGITTANLFVNIGRGKLVRHDKKHLDSAHPVNAAFIQKYQGKGPQVMAAAPEKKDAPSDPGKAAREAELKELMAMEKETKRLAMETKRKEQALLDARIQKMHGQLMPTDLVKVLFAQHFREVSTSFKQGIDGILSEIGKKARLNGNQVAEIRATMVKIINECVNKSVENSKKSIQQVVSEYQTTKNSA